MSRHRVVSPDYVIELCDFGYGQKAREYVVYRPEGPVRFTYPIRPYRWWWPFGTGSARYYCRKYPRDSPWFNSSDEALAAAVDYALTGDVPWKATIETVEPNFEDRVRIEIELHRAGHA